MIDSTQASVDAEVATARAVAEGPILRVEGLRTYLRTGVSHLVKAVDDVSFDLHRGETLGLVGESGSGKSMTCLSILRLAPTGVDAMHGGRVLFRDVDLLRVRESDMQTYRGRRIGLILQDPMTSLNPILPVGEQVAEPIRLHTRLRGRAVLRAVHGRLRQMRLPTPEFTARAYPHQLSGGMRQRVGGAIAMAGNPDVLIADEPTTALDATVQVQFLTLLRDLQRQTGLAILFVTHDFGIVAAMCDRVAVMYAGKIVEQADVKQLFGHPAHPYTQALLRSVPKLDVEVDRLPSIEGQPPDLSNLGPGCAFAPRCPLARDVCWTSLPPSVPVAPDHYAACWELSDRGE